MKLDIKTKKKTEIIVFPNNYVKIDNKPITDTESECKINELEQQNKILSENILKLQNNAQNCSNQFKTGDIYFTYTRLNGKVEKMMIDKDELLSTNFPVRNFLMKDSTSDKVGLTDKERKELILDERVVIVCQHLRDFFEIPIVVNSGYRNEKYNLYIGGSKTSQHKLGKACDLGLTPSQVKEAQYLIIKNWKLLGVRGLETSTTGWLHFDFRDRNDLLTF